MAQTPQNTNTSKCPVCSSSLHKKGELLFCPKCKIYIGSSNASQSRGLSLLSKPKGKQTTTEQYRSKNSHPLRSFLFFMVVIGAIGLWGYYYQPWNYFLRHDYTHLQVIQDELVFPIYAPRLIPSGFILNPDRTATVRDDAEHISRISFTYTAGVKRGTLTLTEYLPEKDFVYDKDNSTNILSTYFGDSITKKVSIEELDLYVTVRPADDDRTKLFWGGISFRDGTIIVLSYEGIRFITESDFVAMLLSLTTLDILLDPTQSVVSRILYSD